MVHVQLLQIEIQNLKDALEFSQKKVDRYAQLVTTLYDELDNLRSNICHKCKKKFVPDSVSDPNLSPGRDAATPSTSDDTSSNSAISSSIPAISVGTRETIFDAVVDTPISNSSREQTPISSEPESEPPEFVVEYNPEVKRALDLHLDHVFPYESPAWSVTISHDGQRMAVGFRDSGATIISDTKTRSNIRVLVDHYVKDELLIWSVKFSPDGRLLATGGDDARIRIWDTARNRMRAMFKWHKQAVNTIAFSPDGRSIVSGSDDYSVRISNIRDGVSKRLPVTGPTLDFFLSVVFSPDGRYIAAGDTKKLLWVWHSRTQRLVANWMSHSDSVWCVEFTPDGKGLVSGSRDATAIYWDVSSLEIHEAASGRDVCPPGHSFPSIRSFSGHTGVVRAVAFFPSQSEWVITSSDDGSVRVWDMRTGDWQLVIRGHGKSVMEVATSGTENFLASASTDRYVTLWRYEML